MKKSFLTFSAILIVVFFIASCNGTTSTTETKTNSTDSVKVAYTCPMHPEVTSDKPGSCPECGMDLTEKK